MGELKIERSVTHALENTIGLKGVREDDQFSMELFQESKQVHRLKRTKYRIITASKFEFNFKTSEISLPVFGSTPAEFELVLIPDFRSRNFNEKSRYLMRSLSNHPFRLNGVQCFEAFLERGDLVDIGFNRIHFLKPKNLYLIEENQEYLTEEIVRSSLNIMIEGETGSGKTTLARKIHQASERGGRFIHLNLSSFSPSLIESEIFGHVKGAFTGAISEKRGAILEAHRGTLFLDEIDSLSIELQTKLLLFLDSLEVRAVGGNSTQKADVRLIFASGSRLKQLVESEKMRRDFYYRLISGVVICLPSLRDNPKVIKELCQKYESENYVILSDELIAFYQECSWPGNIRQLMSHLNKKKILSLGKKIVLDNIDNDLLYENEDSLWRSFNMKPLEEVKMDYCLNVFIRSDKNYAKSSKILDISPNTLKALLANREKLISLRSDKVVDVDI